MKIITTHTKVYPYGELSEKSKKQAIQNLCDINIDHDWWDSTYDDAESIGLKITGFDLDRSLGATGSLKTSAFKCAEKICKEHGKNCDTRILAERYLMEWGDKMKLRDSFVNDDSTTSEQYDAYQGICNALEGAETEFERALLEQYAHILQKEYEYLTSQEAIEESILCNEYQFTEDGKLF